MFWMAHARSHRWLVLHFQGLLPLRKEKKLWRHLAQCQECQALHMTLTLAEKEGLESTMLRHQRLEKAIFGPAPEARPLEHVYSWKMFAGAGVAVCAAVLLTWSFLPSLSRPTREFREKGSSVVDYSRFVSLSIYRHLSEGEFEPVNDQVVRGEGLAFGYSNLAEAGFDRLMLFGVDELYNVYWFYPAWTDSQTNPSAVAIRQGKGIELPEEVIHEYEGSWLRIFALFSTRRDLTVKSIEKIVEGLKRHQVRIAQLPSFPLENFGQVTVLLRVNAQ